MKSLLVFVFFSVTSCLAAPGCTEADLMKCSTSSLDENATEEQLLEKDCRHIECVLELHARCGDGVFPQPRIPDYFPEKGYKKILNSVCVKTNPIRKKYLDTATCSRDALVRNRNAFYDCIPGGETREEFCRTIVEGLQCVVDYLGRECGPDAAEAYPYANAIHYDPFDCLE